MVAGDGAAGLHFRPALLFGEVPHGRASAHRRLAITPDGVQCFADQRHLMRALEQQHLGWLRIIQDQGRAADVRRQTACLTERIRVTCGLVVRLRHVAGSREQEPT